MTVPPEKIAFVDIYPPIGIARVGDSDEYYLGPEIPGVEPIQKNGFKDSQHRIKKQAVRFRVYAYGEDSQLLGELTDGKEYALEWTVHVANKKAAWVKFRGRYEDEEWNLRNPEVQPWPKNTEPTYEYTDQRDQLIIDSGEQRVSKISQQPVPLQGQFCNARPDEKKEPVDVNLGSLLTDEHGRLVFLPSNGDSFCTRDSNRHPDLESEMDNNDWVDSTCDGTVKVAVKSHKSPETKIKLRNKATIITAPPKFTPGIQSVTSLLDLIEDIYENQDRKEDYKLGDVDFYRHIYPIFKRVYLISWTNLYATLGHGPMKADFFLNNPDLYDPKAGPAAERLRKHIFERARAPIREHDEENKRLREHQADSFFMPRLGGSDGDLPETTKEWKKNGRNRYASMTQLQYDRLAKWADGDFETGKPEAIYGSFDVILPEDQPEALTRAALEWSVGVPLYPGIEVYWGAELEDKYNFGAKYRFSDDVKPGDLGKGLALPWQSDFFMCNTHWWPSIRPDNIVTEEFFTNTTNHFQDNKNIIALNLTERVRWDRGLERDPYDSDDSDEDSFDIRGTSDMVRKWSKLGFITQEQSGSGDFPFPVYVERERHPDF